MAAQDAGPSSYLFITLAAARAEAVVGALAQLGEHLLCKQRVIGSIPIGSTRFGQVGQVRGLLAAPRQRLRQAGPTRDGSVAQVVRAYA
jgi:hypothetical protein